MPLRQSDLNELFDVNGMAFKHRNEQLRNDLDAFYAGAKNAALSGVAGLAGTVGDFESLVKTLVQAKQGYILPNKTVAPTSERLAEMMGADLNSPSGWAGLIGVPDLTDIGKLGLAGYKGAMVLAHGSPHKFSKFSMKHIGTGEGAQAYGHGLYFAQDPKVAGAYKSRFNQMANDGNLSDAEWATHNVYDRLDADKDAAVKELTAQMERHKKHFENTGMPAAKKKYDQAKESLDYINSERFNPGNLYEVDIPDEQIAKMLDWDKPLGEQKPETVQKLRAAFKDHYGRDVWDEYGFADIDVKDVLHNSIDDFDNVGDIEKLLNKHGIPGIKYLDGTSRSAGEGTRNIVAFDDSMIKILKRNGQPVE